jgi:hypothetical protein
LAGALFSIAEAGLLFFLGLRGNDWLASHLESGGYTHDQTIEAEGFGEALEIAAQDDHAA